MPKGKGAISSAERAALIARERALYVWRVVHLFHLLHERRGLLTIAQIQRMSRLLTDHADVLIEHVDVLYRRADLVEYVAASPRPPPQA